VTLSVGPKEAALRKARESKAGGKKAEEGDPEHCAEEAHGEEESPAKVAKMLTFKKGERANVHLGGLRTPR
jgi:hypothetical protein